MAFALTGKLSLDARDFVAGTDKAARSVGDIGDAFGEIPKDAKKATDGASQELGKLPDEGGKVGKLTGGKMGTAMAAGFGAIGVGALVMQGINQAMDANAGVKRLQGQFALSAEDAQKYGDMAGDLYAEGWGEGVQEVQQVVYWT